ncbi:hypothetical protein ACVW1C_004228 [Bradyrhizobium sp. USDA 4011]
MTAGLRVAVGTPGRRAALRAGYFHAAQEIPLCDLHRASLTPAAVATELGTSLRQLHALFEPA